MASWDELRNHLSNHFDVGVDDGKLFGVDVEYGDGRKQRVFASHEAAYGKQFVQFRSLVAKADKIAAREALRTNANLAIGALMLKDDMYFVQHRTVLDEVPLSALEFTMRTVATIADHLEAAHSGGKDLF